MKKNFVIRFRASAEDKKSILVLADRLQRTASDTMRLLVRIGLSVVADNEGSVKIKQEGKVNETGD